jgi:hypothetical protein
MLKKRLSGHFRRTGSVMILSLTAMAAPGSQTTASIQRNWSKN